MTKKYSLTPEHKIELYKIRDKYIANARRTDAMTDHDREMMLVAMRGLYKNARLPYPGDNKIIFVSSPLVAQFASGIAMAILNGSADAAAIDADNAAVDAAAIAADNAARATAARAAYNAAMDGAAADAVEAAASAAARAADNAASAAARAAAAGAAVEADNAAVDAAAADAAGGAAERAAAAGAAVEAGAFSKENSLDIFLSAFIGLAKGYGEFSLLSVGSAWRYRTRSALWPWYQVYGDFFKNVAKLPGEWEKWDPLNLDALHGGVRFMTPEFTIISDRPEILKMDDRGLLHSETGCAVKWRDGMEQFYWHGTSIPDRWITDKKSITPDVALKWDNIEQRRCAMEIVGWNNILKEIGAITIDKDHDPQIGELLEVSHPAIGQKEKFLKVLCATGRVFSIPVPPEMKTALEANAWTYQIDGDTLRKIKFRT